MKIIRFPNKEEEILEDIQNMKDYVEQNKIDNFLITFKDKNKHEMCSCYFNLDLGEKMEMLGHIQADIMDQMVETNIDKYIEILE